MVTCSALKWKEVILLKYSHVGLACRIIFKYLPQNSAWPPNSHLNSMSVTKKHKFYISTDFCICLCPFFSVTVSNWKSKLQSKFVRYPKNVFEIVFLHLSIFRVLSPDKSGHVTNTKPYRLFFRSRTATRYKFIRLFRTRKFRKVTAVKTIR